MIFASGKRNEIPYVICVDLTLDKSFLIDGEEVQVLREVLAELEEPKCGGLHEDGGGMTE